MAVGMRVVDTVLVVGVDLGEALGWFPVGLPLRHDTDGVLLDFLEGNGGHPLQDVVRMAWS